MVEEELDGEGVGAGLVGGVVKLGVVVAHPEEAVVVVPGWVSVSCLLKNIQKTSI